MKKKERKKGFQYMVYNGRNGKRVRYFEGIFFGGF